MQGICESACVRFEDVSVQASRVLSWALSRSLKLKDAMTKSGLIAELTMYLKDTKSYWLAPVMFVLLAMSALAFFLEGSVLAPAIYSVF